MPLTSYPLLLESTMRRLSSSLIRLLLAAILVLPLSGCLFNDLVNQMLQAHTDPLQALKNTTAEQRQQILSEVYGRDVIYIAPAQRDAMFSDLRSFVWNVAAGNSLGPDVLTELIQKRMEPGGPGVPDALLPYADELSRAGHAWAEIKKLNIDENRAVVDQRLAALKTRMGIDAYNRLMGQNSDGQTMDGSIFEAYPNDNQAIEFVWNPAPFNRLMTDDDWAVSQVAILKYGALDGPKLLDLVRQNLGPAFGAVTDRTGSAF